MSLISPTQKFKQKIYNLLINSLRKSAKLDYNSTTLSVGKVVYLDNSHHAGKEKDTVVLIHGLGADKDTWLYLSKYLTKQYRIIAPDLPGHGDSIEDFSLNYSIEQQAKHLLDLLNALKIEKVHLIGSSMGGAVATRLAYMRPEAVLSLILIDSYGVIKTPSHVHKLAEHIGYNPMLEINNRKDYKQMMSLAMVTPPFIPGFILDVLVDKMKTKVALNKKIFEVSEADSELGNILPKVQAPSLVIWGADDNVLHVDNAEVFNRSLQNCSKVVLDKVGHVPMVECPKVAAQHVHQFIKSL